MLTWLSKKSDTAKILERIEQQLIEINSNTAKLAKCVKERGINSGNESTRMIVDTNTYQR